MATGARVERPQRHQNQQFRERIPQQKPRHKRWIWRLGFLLIALATLAWFLPAIIVNTPVLGWVVRKASGSLKCAVSVQSASLGWLSPISISGVAVRDEQNQALVEVERDHERQIAFRNTVELHATRRIPPGKAHYFAGLARGRQQRGRPAGEFQER